MTGHGTADVALVGGGGCAAVVVVATLLLLTLLLYRGVVMGIGLLGWTSSNQILFVQTGAHLALFRGHRCVVELDQVG